MRIAMPIWENRISPVFDTAGRILIFDICRGKITSKNEIAIDENFLPKRARKLAEHGVDLVICSGISKALRSFLNANNIEVRDGVIGETEMVIEAFLNRCLNNQRFRMPGCGRCGRRGRKFRNKND